MAIWEVSFSFLDRFDATTSKRFQGDFVDYATASAAASALLTDLQSLTDAHVTKMTLTEVTPVAGAPGPDSNVFERISATVEIGTNKYANLQVPSPVEAAFSGNALNPVATVWTDFIANFATAWTVSDGENVSDTIAGKRIFVRSGNTNLPS